MKGVAAFLLFYGLLAAVQVASVNGMLQLAYQQNGAGVCHVLHFAALAWR